MSTNKREQLKIIFNIFFFSEFKRREHDRRIDNSSDTGSMADATQDLGDEDNRAGDDVGGDGTPPPGRRNLTDALNAGSAESSQPKKLSPEQKVQNDLLWRYFKKSKTRFDWSTKGGVDTKFYRAVCQCETSDSTPENKRLCLAELARKQANTSTMRSHLATKHTLIYDELLAKELDAKQKLHQGRRKLQRTQQEADKYDDWASGNCYFIFIVSNK